MQAAFMTHAGFFSSRYFRFPFSGSKLANVDKSNDKSVALSSLYLEEWIGRAMKAQVTATKTQIYFQQKRKCKINKTATRISRSATASVSVLYKDEIYARRYLINFAFQTYILDSNVVAFNGRLRLDTCSCRRNRKQKQTMARVTMSFVLTVTVIVSGRCSSVQATRVNLSNSVWLRQVVLNKTELEMRGKA